jgi:hypothetical protein
MAFNAVQTSLAACCPLRLSFEELALVPASLCAEQSYPVSVVDLFKALKIHNQLTRRFAFAATSVLTAVLAGQAAFAQQFDAQPITFDVDTDSLLVVAFEPSNAAPRLAVFSAAPGQTAQDVIALRTGYPKPSIIVGRISAGMEKALGIERLLPATVAQYGFAFDDLAAREALRSSNPDVFVQLVNEGHVDPPEAQLATTVQQELARMNCYRSRVDGDWGAGSRRAATQYFTTLGKSDDGLIQTASPELFRAVVLGGDVTCAVAARASAPARKAAPARNAAPAKKAAPAKPSKGPTITGGGIGVFR